MTLALHAVFSLLFASSSNQKYYYIHTYCGNI